MGNGHRSSEKKEGKVKIVRTPAPPSDEALLQERLRQMDVASGKLPRMGRKKGNNGFNGESNGQQLDDPLRSMILPNHL
ncbi:MAG: hypothetical protein NUV97_00285 [archaeon]|nr:hypothetical protein [archaeon]MCR4323614.1 hypothetical protein [Nanoarchaeota archaeon]